jgi:DNA polymerase-3 subunit delta
VLTGPNDFQRKYELDQLVAPFIAEHTDMAVERYDGEEIDAARMRESLQSLPFLTARRLVILRTPSKQKDFTENITQILDTIADSTDVIIIEPKLDKRLSYYKTLKKQTDFRECADLDAGGLARWACMYTKEQGGNLQTPDARELVDRLGINQQMLRLELDKLLAFDPNITGQSVELLTVRLPQSTVFELLDAAFAGKAARALALYNEQRALKVEPQAIIAMLAWQLHILLTVKVAAKISVEDIAKAAKLNPFVVRKSQGLVRNVTLQQLKKQVEDLLLLDHRLKRTMTNPDEAVQLYLLQISA